MIPLTRLTRFLTLAVATAGPAIGRASAAKAIQPDPAPATAPGSLDPPDDRAAFERQLRAIDARAVTIKSLRGAFVQRKHTPLLKKPMISSGTFAIRGNLTCWRTLEPRRSVISIDEHGLRLYYPDQGVVEVYELGEDIRELAASPLPHLGKLEETFHIDRDRATEHPGAGGPPLLRVALSPRTDEMKEHITRIRVLIDPSVPVVRWMEIEDIDGERTEIELKDVEADAEIADAEVLLEMPPGTREVHPLRGSGGEPGRPKDQVK